ncbi:MAG: nuclear transport factor 2 family protein [Bacteroidota bacterium]
MKKSIIGLLTIVSFLFAKTTLKAQSDKAQVEKLVHNYFDALNSGDAGKVTSFFTKNGVLLAQGAPTASGSDQVNATFKYVFDNFKYSLEVTVGEVIVQGNYAIVASTSKGSFVIKAKGETVTDNFRETFVMQKEGGSWKIARYMYNKDK